MSLWGTLHGSSLAMMAHSTGMGTLSQNIANVNTTGYKRTEALFKTLMTESTPKHDFFSTKAVTRNLISAQGNMLSTGRGFDLGVNGRGFFIVNTTLDGSGQTLFTRDGAFRQEAFDRDGDGQADSYRLVTQGGHYLQGVPVNDDGTFTVGGLAGLQPIEVFAMGEEDGRPTANVELHANIPASSDKPETIVFPAYDNAFKVNNVTATWTRTAAGAWDLDFSLPPGAGTVTAPAAGETQVTFGADANLIAPQEPIQVSFEWADGSASTVAVDITRMTQYAGNMTVHEIKQDGFGTGHLVKTNIDRNGVLFGAYSNGVTRPLYKIPLATFPAPDKLDPINGNMFRLTAEAGDLEIIEADASLSGAEILAGVLETSNVDLADQFSRIITTQTAYNMASTVFTTGDEMFKTAIGLKR